MLDLILCAFTYVVLTYLLVVLLKKRKNDNGSDDGDGGTKIDRTPVIDLPPGVSWPTPGTHDPIYRLPKELESLW
jgi:hypothetical protein